MASAWTLSSQSWLQSLYSYELKLATYLERLGVQIAPVPVLGDIGAPGVYNLPDVTPTTTEAASYTAAGTPVRDTYTGVTLWNLLDRAGGVVVSSAKNDILSKYVVATGSDGYKAVFSLDEIDPQFGNQPVLAAYSDTAGQLGQAGRTHLLGWLSRATSPAGGMSRIS